MVLRNTHSTSETNTIRGVTPYGRKVRIGVGVKIQNPELITLEDNVKICDGASLIARPGTEIYIGKNTVINNRVYLDTE